MAAAVLMPTVSFRDESIHEDWQVLGKDESKKKILVKQTSKMQSEREISMDPKSLRSLSLSGSIRRNDSFDMIRLPAMSPPRNLDAPMPLPLQPVRTKFVSRSLPNSAAASPRQRSGQMLSSKSKENYLSSASHKRSKSWGSSSKRLSLKSSGIRNSFFIKTESNKSINNNNNTFEDGFKCNALCFYLPSFSKGKPVRSGKEDSSSFTRTVTTTTSTSVTVLRTVSVKESTTTTTAISAQSSMEKFDCGSYTSESAGDEGGGHLFDSPSELIKSGSGNSDQDNPVSAAFVFDKEPIEKEIKGVLKVSGSDNSTSMESPSLRHVRFSTSSPVSYPTSPAISPRLLEATKNFNAFSESQSV